MNLSAVSGLVTIVTLAGVTFALHPGTIIGTVNDNSGRAVVGVQIVVDGDCSTLTGPEGQFTLLAVEHGEHLLRATSPGFEAFEDTVMVRAGDTLRRNVTLVPRASQGERDSSQARLLAILSMRADTSQQWWVHSCH